MLNSSFSASHSPVPAQLPILDPPSLQNLQYSPHQNQNLNQIQPKFPLTHYQFGEQLNNSVAFVLNSSFAASHSPIPAQMVVDQSSQNLQYSPHQNRIVVPPVSLQSSSLHYSSLQPQYFSPPVSHPQNFETQPISSSPANVLQLSQTNNSPASNPAKTVRSQQKKPN